MITQEELEALLHIIRRAPINQAEIIAINSIIEKLAAAVKKQEAKTESA